jgi:hypothetical protein
MKKEKLIGDTLILGCNIYANDKEFMNKLLSVCLKISTLFSKEAT